MCDSQQPLVACEGEVVGVTLKMKLKTKISRWWSNLKYNTIIKYREFRKRTVTEQDKELIDSWYKEAHDIKNFKELKKFMKKMMSYTHDYGTICHATTAAAIGAAWVIDRDPISGGITGFQASIIMWEFIQRWMGKEPPMRLLEYKDMLYPQFKYKFEKNIGKATWEFLQSKAKAELDERTHAHPQVIKHWKSIVAGKVPFGYKVKEEN